MEAAVLLGLIVLNGLFAMSEVALLTARKARLQRLVAEGDQSAAAALALGDDPTRFLSTIQIGITSIGVLNGIVGQAAFAEPLARWLLSLGVAQEIGGGEVDPLDRRYDIILIHVSRQTRCYGLPDIDMRVDIQADT